MQLFNVPACFLAKAALPFVVSIAFASSANAVRFYGSFTADEEIGGTTFLEEDVLQFDDTNVSLLQATAGFFTSEEDLDALYVDDTGGIYFSTSAGATIALGVDGGAGGIESGDIVRYDTTTQAFSLFLADAGPNVDAFWIQAGVPYVSFSTDDTIGANNLAMLDDHVVTLTGGSGSDLSTYTATVVLDANDFLLDPDEEPDSGTDIDAFAITSDGKYLFSSSSSNSFLIEGGDPEVNADYISRDGGVIYILDPNDTASFDAREESSIYYDATALLAESGSTNIDAIHSLPAEDVLIDADFNGDTVVDAEDYTLWRDSLGETGLAPYDLGDANGDGAVDAADYAAWRLAFDTAPGLEATPTNVPEPVSAVLGIGLTLLVAVGTRRNSDS